jgi:hypothetical protein
LNRGRLFSNPLRALGRIERLGVGIRGQDQSPEASPPRDIERKKPEAFSVPAPDVGRIDEQVV